MIDLISERAGGEVLACNDEFFAPARNLIATEAPVAKDEYTDRGKWMDGWETRRRRDPGHDWCVMRLGIPGRIESVVVDTSHFTGNFPQQFSLDGCGVDDPEIAEWAELIPMTDLSGDSVARFEVTDPHRVTLVRLNIFPDGGVARLRVEGGPIPATHLVCSDSVVDLAGAVAGGEVVDASDVHYSHPSNLLRPTRPAGMWDGWETRRRRDEGHDWVIVRLGLPGTVEHLVVDTTHFKGNSPGWVSCELSADGETWRLAADHIPVRADQVNQIRLDPEEPAALLRLSIHPDGGVARLRVMGRAHPGHAAAARLVYANSLFDQAASGFFSTACAAGRWVKVMSSRRPYESVSTVLSAAEEAFDELDVDEWLEAFAGHPRIGERGDETASREQAGLEGADERVLSELREVNREYESRFGFTYIVFATDKTASDMLAIAQDRLGHTREQEITNASAEQREITATRLRRMFCQEET